MFKGQRLKGQNLVTKLSASPARSVQTACHVRPAEKTRWRLKRSTRELCEASDFVKVRWPELSVMTERDETIDA